MPSHRRVRPLCLRLSKKPLNCPSKMNHSPFQEQSRALFLTSGLTRRCCYVKHGLKQSLDILRRPHQEAKGAPDHHSTRSIFPHYSPLRSAEELTASHDTDSALH